MEKDELRILAEGLKRGFAGETERGKQERGGFVFETSHYSDEQGTYHDEWLADRVGGGQEVIETTGVRFTRLYGGGTISVEELEGLGLTKKEVMVYLITKIRELGDKTRLLDECSCEDGEWEYEYRKLDEEVEIPLVTRKEVIRYKGRVVFVHNFLICPIE